MQPNDPPGTREYEDFLDKDIIVQMFNNQLIYGILRSFDQFNNITLERCTTRIFHKNEYAEKKLGVYMIRGENIVFLGLSGLNLKKFILCDWNDLETKIKETNPN